MESQPVTAATSLAESRLGLVAFGLCLLFHLWGVKVGWESHNLPGLEFRQAQTALSAYYIQQNHDFSLAYPTPVFGKPWSIPLEFPLYQWTAVVLSDLTGLDLTKAGRLVSMACFYLCLPAVFLMLGRMKVAAARRWWVLALVLTCPLYIFYARAFLMETMALLFSLWFWVAFEHTVESRSYRWLSLAILAGSGAGLVKVTTFIVYLLPAAWWAARRLWSNRAKGGWRSDLAWMTAAVALPFALTLWWLRFADATKALNPSAVFLLSANLHDFTLGTWADRFSLELWRQKWAIITGQLSTGPVLAAGLVLAVLSARRRAPDMLRLLLWFGAALAIFPVLYALHEYYFIANALLLLVALGLVLVGLGEKGSPVWLVALAMLVMGGGQAYQYLAGDYLAQRGISVGGDGLTRSLRGLTRPDEVIIITGQDWNSMVPYYAERRALMIRRDVEQNSGQLEAAFAALAGERIGALVLGPATQGREDLIRRATALGIDPHPLYHWQGVSVHVLLARRRQSIHNIIETGYDALAWEPGVELPAAPMAGAWLETQDLRSYQRQVFSAMRPQPVRFFSTFGPILDGSRSVPRFGAHPVTRLVYRLPAGGHTLRTTAFFSPEAYDPALPKDKSTDGVEITLTLVGSGVEGERRVLYTRLLDPRGHSEDRGMQLIKASFVLDQGAEVELLIGPGPSGRDTRDWIWLGRLVID